jgi:hypothetical protein
MTCSACTTPTMRPCGVDDGKGVEVVFVEHFGQLVLVQVGRAGEDAGLGQHAQVRSRAAP